MDAHPAPYDGVNMAVMFFPLVMLLLAFTYGILMIPSLVTVEPHYRVRDAVTLLHEHRVSQLPVVSSHDPTTMVGAIGERGLLRRAAADPAPIYS